MTAGDFFIIIPAAAIIAFIVISYVKKFKSGKNCCGTETVKLKKKKLKKCAGTFTLYVEGMHCENCRKLVTEAVNSLDGYSAKTDILKKECRVNYEKEADIKKVIDSIKKAGFYAEKREKIK